jgi:hypothetical protein
LTGWAKPNWWDGFMPLIAGALAAATRFGLKAAESKKILREVFAAVSGWRKTGRQLRLKATTLDAYVTAFENPLMDFQSPLTAVAQSN